MLFVCPVCKEELVDQSCLACGLSFHKSPIPSFICKEMYASEKDYTDAVRVIEFWGNGWRKRLDEPGHAFMYQFDAGGLKSYAEQSLA